jgi:hypothetical protein
MKQSYDRLGDKALEKLNAISSTNSGVEDVSEKPTEAKRDLYQLLRDNAKNDEDLRNLWDEVTTVPQWVDWDQISRGQDVFHRYGVPIVTGLVLQSLLGGMVNLPVHEAGKCS